MRRGTFYPYRHDSTTGRYSEFGGSLTPSVAGLNDWRNGRRFKGNLLSEPVNGCPTPDAFLTVGPNSPNRMERIRIGAIATRRGL